MNDTGLWLIAVLGCAVALAVLLRRRYGNLYVLGDSRYVIRYLSGGR